MASRSSCSGPPGGPPTLHSPLPRASNTSSRDIRLYKCTCIRFSSPSTTLAAPGCRTPRAVAEIGLSLHRSLRLLLSQHAPCQWTEARATASMCTHAVYYSLAVAKGHRCAASRVAHEPEVWLLRHISIEQQACCAMVALRHGCGHTTRPCCTATTSL